MWFFTELFMLVFSFCVLNNISMEKDKKKQSQRHSHSYF